MTGSWQDWVVALIVVLCFVRVGMSVWNTYQRSRDAKADPCATCSQPCDIKRLYEQKQAGCQGKEKKTKKSCCE